MTILITIPRSKEFEANIYEIAGNDANLIWRERPQVTDEDAASADIVLGNIPGATVHASEKIKFMQLFSVGINDYTAPGILSDKTILCNASGAYGVAISEHMLGELLMLIKRLNIYEGNRKNHLWQDEGNVRTIYDSTTLVLGAGNIGDSFGRRMHALGSRVIGIRRTAHAPADYMCASGTTEEIDRYLPEADYVFCSLPGTPETAHLFTAERVARMKRGAILLNCGRGSLIATDVLVSALKNGTLGGACLDVTEIEPLPEDSELWDCPNLVLTPHSAGRFHAQVTVDNIRKICLDNLRSYLAGEPLRNVVNRSAGY